MITFHRGDDPLFWWDPEPLDVTCMLSEFVSACRRDGLDLDMASEHLCRSLTWEIMNDAPEPQRVLWQHILCWRFLHVEVPEGRIVDLIAYRHLHVDIRQGVRMNA